jgi:predicted acyltransferase
MALIFIGLCIVNSCHGVTLDEAAMGMSGAWWRILMFLGLVVFWNRYPAAHGVKQWLFTALRIFAAALLIYLLTIYRVNQDGASVWLQSRWWGIIGIIGWAYLISAFVWLHCRNHDAAIMGVLALSIALNIGIRSGMLSWWNGIVDASNGWFPGIPTLLHGSMAIAGMTVAALYRPHSPATTPRSRIVWILLFGAGFAAAGLLLRSPWGIHKSNSTPAWVLCSLAIACAVYAMLYWLADVKKITRWTALIAPAGSNTLLMYMLPYIFYSVLAVLGIDALQTHFHEGWTGVARSAVLAVCLVGVTGLLTRCGIRLKV